jgi:predicted DNA-binding transcriptional regulator AlpA
VSAPVLDLRAIAKALGLGEVETRRLAARDGFPEPVGVNAGGRVAWAEEAIYEWADETGRELSAFGERLKRTLSMRKRSGDGRPAPSRNV